MGCYNYRGVVVYGTGYRYRGWCGPAYYYPRPVTWGFAFRYNSYRNDWGFGLSLNFGNVAISFADVSYNVRRDMPREHHDGWWGPASYHHFANHEVAVREVRHNAFTPGFREQVRYHPAPVDNHARSIYTRYPQAAARPALTVDTRETRSRLQPAPTMTTAQPAPHRSEPAANPPRGGNVNNRPQETPRLAPEASHVKPEAAHLPEEVSHAKPDAPRLARPDPTPATRFPAERPARVNESEPTRKVDAPPTYRVDALPPVRRNTPPTPPTRTMTPAPSGTRSAEPPRQSEPTPQAPTTPPVRGNSRVSPTEGRGAPPTPAPRIEATPTPSPNTPPAPTPTRQAPVPDGRGRSEREQPSRSQAAPPPPAPSAKNRDGGTPNAGRNSDGTATPDASASDGIPGGRGERGGRR